MISTSAPTPLDPHLFLRPRPPCASRLSCDLQAFRLPEFKDPLLAALGGLVLGVVVVLAWRASAERRGRRRLGPEEPARPLPIAGLLVVAAALAGYERTGHLVPGLGVAVLLLAAGGLLADLVDAPLLVRMALAVPGAFVLVQHSALPDPRWATSLAGAVTVVGSGLVADVDRRAARLGLGPVLLAVSMVGLYECEPDPDFALLLVGATVPLALLAWPLVLARLGGPGAAAMTGFLTWAAAVGGRGRLSAVVTGIACLGLLAVLPLARLALFWRRSLLDRLPARWWMPLALGLVQLAGVAAMTTVAPGRSPRQAAEIVAVALAAALLLACLLSARRGDPTARGGELGAVATANPGRSQPARTHAAGTVAAGQLSASPLTGGSLPGTDLGR